MIQIFKFLGSLKLAVFVLIFLVISICIGTILESFYNAKVSSYYVYRANWFRIFLLGTLAINIYVSALIRFPWNISHMPFLTAHIGILSVLYGSFINYKYGIDGKLIVSENESQNMVDLDKKILVKFDKEKIKPTIFNIPWFPNWVDKSLNFNDDIFVDKIISSAEPVLKFKKSDVVNKNVAISIRLFSKIAGINQRFWLFSGEPSLSSNELGPARFILLTEDQISDFGFDSDNIIEKGSSRILFILTKENNIKYKVFSKSKPPKSGIIEKNKVTKKPIYPGWMNMRIDIEEFILNAENISTFKKAHKFYPNPVFAIYVHHKESNRSFWMHQGETIDLDKNTQIGFYEKKFSLPFKIYLKKFVIDKYHGSDNHMNYSSKISIIDSKNKEPLDYSISMNNPLHFEGYRFYQASFIDSIPRPTTTIISVNYDPGRFFRNYGSLFIVFGIILLFVVPRSYTQLKQIIWRKS